VRAETDTALAQRLVREALKKEGRREIDLALARKGDPIKVQIAAQLRRQTPMKRLPDDEGAPVALLRALSADVLQMDRGWLL
jgi:hypothetical protein